MAKILKLNQYSGLANPVQMQDFQYLWESINTIAPGSTQNVYIVSGCTVGGIDIFEGSISYLGQAYALSNGVAQIDDYLYAQTIQIEPRVFEDGVSRNMYTSYIINADKTDTAQGKGELIGQATEDNLDAWRVANIGQEVITATMLANNSVIDSKITSSAVVNTKIASRSIDSRTLDKCLVPVVTADSYKNVYSTSTELFLFNLNNLVDFDQSNILDVKWRSAAIQIGGTKSSKIEVSLNNNSMSPNTLAEMPSVISIVVNNINEGVSNVRVYSIMGINSRSPGVLYELNNNSYNIFTFTKGVSGYILSSSLLNI